MIANASKQTRQAIHIPLAPVDSKPAVYATAVERTGDRKLSACPEPVPCKRLPCKHARPIAATHAAQQSCPETCPFKAGHGCYAEGGQQRITTLRLNQGATDADPVAIAEQEAAAIDKLSGRHPLRAHVVGDGSAPEAANIIAAACERYTAKHNQPVWTYTHAWRTVPRTAWRGVSVLASCETEQDIADATAAGYGVAIVRPHADLARTLAGLRTIACPQQTRAKRDCASCLMCAKDSRLAGRAIIVLDPHGDTAGVNAAIAGRARG